LEEIDRLDRNDGVGVALPRRNSDGVTPANARNSWIKCDWSKYPDSAAKPDTGVKLLDQMTVAAPNIGGQRSNGGPPSGPHEYVPCPLDAGRGRALGYAAADQLLYRIKPFRPSPADHDLIAYQ
jgi:hypothetical protein